DEDTILIGDSTVLSWRTLRTDSIVINNGLGRQNNAESGGIVLHPTTATSYRAIAYNQIGADTATASARVEIPYTVNAVYGTHFKGAMGDGIAEPEFRFRVLDQAGAALRRPWLHFSVVNGDGVLLADSALPDANGAILNDYTFSGQLGYGVVRAMVPGVDTLDVKVRASVIRFGADGQGQYVKLWDTYEDVLALNGTPASVDHPDETKPYYYVNYEQALGVVPIVYDVSGDGVVQDSEPVFEVILNSVFADTSLEGIGVGSTIGSIRAAYGTPDVLVPDPDDPISSLKMIYNSIGVLFYLSKATPDSAVFEIHLWDPTPGSPANTHSKTALTGYSGQAVGVRFSGQR
ncbi:MAG: hypothetical protein NTW07_09765, partial [candidate division Zixibacteria bacterium]|nr:hypothetical protein [candidate division Zixibacteria bacterium]